MFASTAGSGSAVAVPYFDANTNAKNSFIRAMESWRDVTCVNWEVIEPTPSNTTAQDGTNIVRFGNSGELSAGVLATTFSRYLSCNLSKIWYVSEIDLTYDPDVTWNFDASSPKFSEFDIESVTLHELGHAHQLGHDALEHLAFGFERVELFAVALQ